MATAIPDVSLINNSAERTPLVLVLDCSGSMGGEPIAQLNEGLATLEQEMKSDPIVSTQGRVLVITFGGEDEVTMSQWQDAMNFTSPVLDASGRTPTGAAVSAALAAIEAEKSAMRAAGVSYKRPIMLLMTDGEPTDEWESVAAQCVAAEQAKKVNVMAIAIGPNADKEKLDCFSAKKALRLDGLKFKELFVFLSASVKAVSQSATGQAAQIAAPAQLFTFGTD